MDHIAQLEQSSIYLLREAFHRFGGAAGVLNPVMSREEKLALLWSVGKDSTVLLHLARKAFFGRAPFPVVHVDTGFKFKEMYEFRDWFAREWDLDLRVVRNEEAFAKGVRSDAGKLACCSALKTEALKQALTRYGLRALILGIRRDEHGIRAKERVFSPRNEAFRWDFRDQPIEVWDHYRTEASVRTHVRVHPLLDWREIDVWRYIRREGIPVPDLYFAKNGKRYRSIGCEPCCEPVESSATTVDEIIAELETTKSAERAGRAQDKESANTMQQLRALGYM